MHVLGNVLKENGVDPQVSPTAELSEDAVVWMAVALKDYSPASEQLYLAATTGFFKFLSAERLAEINLPRLDLLRMQRARRSGQRLPQFPREEIERVLEFVNTITNIEAKRRKHSVTRNARPGFLDDSRQIQDCVSMRPVICDVVTLIGTKAGP